MTADEARTIITKWAKNYYSENEDDVVPEVKVLSLFNFEHDGEEWQAELSVSTSADEPTVTFFWDERHGYGLQIVSIEY